MTPIITVSLLSKHFKLFKHHRGAFSTLRNLFSQQYRLIKAVDEISFAIMPGELVGYIGPNGAGKSTTYEDVDRSTGSNQRRNPGKRFYSLEGAQDLRFCQRTTLWWDLPVIESLALLQHIYKVPAELFRHNLDEFRKILDLDPFLSTPVRSLSLGQRMRADICAALLHNPDILFLDEPTIGLDVVAKERIRKFIQHINQERNTIVVLTTHDLSDVKKLCERVLIIDHGRLLFDGNLNTLKNRFGGNREMVVENADTYEHPNIEDATIIKREDNRVTYQFPRDTLTASEMIRRLSALHRIRDLEVREPEIEATIRRIYEEQLLEVDH